VYVFCVQSLRLHTEAAPKNRPLDFYTKHNSKATILLAFIWSTYIDTIIKYVYRVFSFLDVISEWQLHVFLTKEILGTFLNQSVIGNQITVLPATMWYDVVMMSYMLWIFFAYEIKTANLDIVYWCRLSNCLKANSHRHARHDTNSTVLCLTGDVNWALVYRDTVGGRGFPVIDVKKRFLRFYFGRFFTFLTFFLFSKRFFYF